MNIRFSRWLMAGLVPVVLLGSGCGRKAQSNPTPAVAQDQVPQAIQDAMAGASPEIQSQAAQLEDAAKQQDPRAVSGLMDLMHRPDVTAAQRAQLARCLPPLLTAAQKAADGGDAKAAEALKAYNVSK